jgi:hypothetical protein
MQRLKRLGEAGNGRASQMAGMLLVRSKRIRESKPYFERAFAAGVPGAGAQLYERVLDLDLRVPSLADSRRLLERDARNGLATVMADLAYRYTIAGKREEAVFWLRKAA